MSFLEVTHGDPTVDRPFALTSCSEACAGTSGHRPFTLRYGFRVGGNGDVDLSLATTIYDNATLLPLAGQPEVNSLAQVGGSTGGLAQGWIRVTANGNIGWRFDNVSANCGTCATSARPT